MEHEKCYVFQIPEHRSAKRRKTDDNIQERPFERRRILYEKLWARQEQRINDLLRSVHVGTLNHIVRFISSASCTPHGGKIPTGLIATGPGTGAHQLLFHHLQNRIDGDTRSVFVLLKSEECLNLKGLLKTLIQKTTKRIEDDAEEAPAFRPRKGPKLLSYDLQLLQDWLRGRDVDSVVVAFEDSEAFSSQVLADVISILNSWLDRIPFVLLFGVATSVDIFHEKLPRAALRCMKGEQFDVVRSEVVMEQVLDCFIGDEEAAVYIGPSLSAMLVDRLRDHVLSIELFLDALKYAYMSHFYANTLSVFLEKDLRIEQVPPDHFEALRNLPSFRKFAEDCLERGEAKQVRSLLESNDTLFSFAVQAIDEERNYIRQMTHAVKLLETIRSCFPGKTPLPMSSMYTMAMAAEVLESTTVRDVLLSMKKASSDVMLKIIEALSALPGGTNTQPAGFENVRSALYALLEASGDVSSSLRSEHDLPHETRRTTLVAKKVELSKQKSLLKPNDTAYSKLASDFVELMEAYFQGSFINPRDLFLHEIFVYDLKSPHRDVFTPKPRYAIERALSSPRDYLGCSCCTNSDPGAASEATLSATQPSTAILYQLYLESGALVNVFDLWSAFNAIANNENTEEAATMAQFYRALAELRGLGVIKPSRKKADHIAKVLWRGL